MSVSDSQLQCDVMEELKWEPSVHHEEIGVAVTGGVVTLSGIVRSLSEKLQAEQAVRRVKGVRAVAEDLVVRYPEDAKLSDTEIAKRVADIIAWDPLIPAKMINATVENGVVRLRGEVDWNYQKDLAAKEASKITGVIRVDNWIKVTPRVAAETVSRKIEEAFKRQADLEAEKIRVRAEGGTVVLEGTVSSWSKRNIAEQAAWGAPGVSEIEDRLVIS